MMWHGIIQCDKLCTRDYSVKRVLLRYSKLLFILTFGWLVPLCRAECPRQNLQETALQCFNNFSTQKVHLDKSGSRLFSGIDIEVLRIFCSSYTDAMTCISNLIEFCPEDKHREIKVALVNFSGMEQELQDLCTTNGLYEKYAQHMTCFMERGQKSDWCFDRHLNVTVNDLTQEDLCCRMREVTNCIENNIRQGCGAEASELVHRLVKPMVRRSGSCTYGVYHHDTQEDPCATKEEKSSNTANKQVHSPHNSTSNLISNILYMFLCLKLTFLSYVFR